MESATAKKILVVEDEASMRTALADTLKDAGFEVVKAEDGEQGLELAVKDRPDLILLDILMPKKDGLTMMKELRAREDNWSKEVPIIWLTAVSVNESMLKEAVKLEPTHYLIKSEVTLEDVLKKVKERLGVN